MVEVGLNGICLDTFGENLPEVVQNLKSNH